MLKVLLVDDTGDRVSALKAALSRLEGVELACIVATPLEWADEVARHRPDIVLVASEVRVAVERFESERRLREELADAKARLDERKLVDRAKGILMKHRGLDEDAAYAALRSLAMARAVRLGDAARQVIDAASLLG